MIIDIVDVSRRKLPMQWGGECGPASSPPPSPAATLSAPVQSAQFAPPPVVELRPVTTPSEFLYLVK